MSKESIAPISINEIAYAIQRLEAITKGFKDYRQYLENSGAEEMWVWRASSLESGMSRLESMVPELSRSVYAHVTGNPQHANSSKSRKPKQDT